MCSDTIYYVDHVRNCCMGSFMCSFPNTSIVWYNRTFAHSRSDSKFIRFYIFLIIFISVTTDKMVPGLAIMERTTNLSICSHNLWTFGQCKQSVDNFIANRSFTSWYNINILKHIMGKIYVNFTKICMKGDYFTRLTWKKKSCETYNFIIKVGNVQILYS